MNLEIKGLNKTFEEKSLYKDFDIEFAEGTITCILGPSGCGKTTLLNIIGKTIGFDNGNLFGFDGKSMSYIFQDPRLLPWKTVSGNIGFVLGDTSSDTKEDTVNRFIKLVELDGFSDYYPSQLSGGMRQRVAIARAFAFPSDLILMDEPLKGLDVKLKLNLIRAFSRIWQNDKRTVIFVTHDVDEALLLGNDIIVLSQPPVTIKTRIKIDLPNVNRSLELPYLKEMEQKLLEILGE